MALHNVKEGLRELCRDMRKRDLMVLANTPQRAQNVCILLYEYYGVKNQNLAEVFGVSSSSMSIWRRADPATLTTTGVSQRAIDTLTNIIQTIDQEEVDSSSSDEDDGTDDDDEDTDEDDGTDDDDEEANHGADDDNKEFEDGHVLERFPLLAVTPPSSPPSPPDPPTPWKRKLNTKHDINRARSSQPVSSCSRCGCPCCYLFSPRFYSLSVSSWTTIYLAFLAVFAVTITSIAATIDGPGQTIPLSVLVVNLYLLFHLFCWQWLSILLSKKLAVLVRFYGTSKSFNDFAFNPIIFTLHLKLLAPQPYEPQLRSGGTAFCIFFVHILVFMLPPLISGFSFRRMPWYSSQSAGSHTNYNVTNLLNSSSLFNLSQGEMQNISQPVNTYEYSEDSDWSGTNYAFVYTVMLFQGATLLVQCICLYFSYRVIAVLFDALKPANQSEEDALKREMNSIDQIEDFIIEVSGLTYLSPLCGQLDAESRKELWQAFNKPDKNLKNQAIQDLQKQPSESNPFVVARDRKKKKKKKSSRRVQDLAIDSSNVV